MECLNYAISSDVATARREDAHGKIVLTNTLDREVSDECMKEIYVIYMNDILTKGEEE